MFAPERPRDGLAACPRRKVHVSRRPVGTDLNALYFKSMNPVGKKKPLKRGFSYLDQRFIKLKNSSLDLVAFNLSNMNSMA